MPTLSFNLTRSGWDWWGGTVSIPYTLTYNSANNRTAISFSQATVTYDGRQGHYTNTTTTITIKAGDNTSSSGTASFTTSGTTNQSGASYYGTPSPSVTVQHSAGPGAKTVTVEASTTVYLDPRHVGSNVGAQYYYVTCTGSRTDTSHTIPYASVIASCTSSVATLGTLALAMTRYSNSYYHKATFKIGSTTLATSSAFATSLSYTVPRSWFNSYPNDTSKTVTVSVQTYTDSSCTTAVGSAATTTFTMTADAGMKPEIAAGFASVSAYNTGTAASGIIGFVQGYSKARLTLYKNQLTMADGATVASYKITCQGATTTVNSPGDTEYANTATLTGTAEIPITVTVTDSRGRTASTTLTGVTPMPYAVPVLTGISVFRCDEHGNADESGTYYSAAALPSCSSLNGQNSIAWNAHKAYLKEAGGSYGGGYNLNLDGSARVLGSGLVDPDKNYVVKIEATDSLGNVGVATGTIPQMKWAMKFRPDGQGVGFGRAPAHDKALEIPADWQIYFGSSAVFDTHSVTDGDITGSSIRVTRHRDMVFVEGYLVTKTQSYTADTTVLFTLPAAARPSGNRFFVMSKYANNFIARIGTDGNAVFNSSYGFSDNSYLFFNFAYRL